MADCTVTDLYHISEGQQHIGLHLAAYPDNGFIMTRKQEDKPGPLKRG